MYLLLLKRNVQMDISENKNDRQVNFNQIKGVIHDISEKQELYPSLTLEVGHENKRLVNFLFKASEYSRIVNNYKKSDKVSVRFYVSSHYKNGRWYTCANALGIDSEVD